MKAARHVVRILLICWWSALRAFRFLGVARPVWYQVANSATASASSARSPPQYISCEAACTLSVPEPHPTSAALTDTPTALGGSRRRMSDGSLRRRAASLSCPAATGEAQNRNHRPGLDRYHRRAGLAWPARPYSTWASGNIDCRHPRRQVERAAWARAGFARAGAGSPWHGGHADQRRASARVRGGAAALRAGLRCRGIRGAVRRRRGHAAARWPG
jgi:hypothetical protein